MTKKTEIEINLTPDQRFWIESEQDGQMLLVSKITINQWGNMLDFEGMSFSVDYEDMKIEGQEKANMHLEYNECGFYTDSDC
ncbi:hypothetical protein [Paenibacillus sp. Marseille-Q4541]|uniref:hypothetical protein n=1 Tax=Paenibacillus sp. Marseille-Q4541 TaxID=2831522 RepID=UPI001BA7DCA9|nr:hypothetical protein [Paenibacillus sp. Marseille-Q4541]